MTDSFGIILLNSEFICVIDTVLNYLSSIWEEGMKWNEIKKNISKKFFTYSCLEVLTEGMKNSFSYLVI